MRNMTHKIIWMERQIMRYFERDGVRLAWQETGPRDGPVVVFNHGFLMDGEMFAPNVAALADTFRCITWDQRGFGATGPADRPFTYWHSALDLIALLDYLEVASASLVGMSQGGFISMRAALLEPDRFRALALISTRSGIDAPAVQESFQQLKTEWAANGAANVADHLGAFLIGTLEHSPDWVAKWRNMSPDRFGYPVDALVDRDDITPRLAEITHASIVFHGSADAAIDPAYGRELAERLPNCKDFVLVEGAGHTPNLTHAQAVNPKLREFMMRYAR
jgi:3-oxoadipate enol-lactonase